MYALVSVTNESTFRTVLAKGRTHVFRDVIGTDDRLFSQSEKSDELNKNHFLLVDQRILKPFYSVNYFEKFGRIPH